MNIVMNGKLCKITVGILSTLCKYDLREGYLFVLSWEKVQRVSQGSIFSELLMYVPKCMSLVARCIETIDVCK